MEGMPMDTHRHGDKEEGHTLQEARVLVTVGLLVVGLSLGTAHAATKPKGKPLWHATHTMSGTVTEVDHTTGMLSLQTPEGELKSKVFSQYQGQNRVCYNTSARVAPCIPLRNGEVIV
jgi:hypothetical protein